jgi:4-amino-4-deoxy-L-arabinose transferase-like glycosyltransferase
MTAASLRAVDMASVAANAAHGVRPYVLLSLLCLVLFAPGLGALPPMDRDEARYMQATKQMIESGDYADIRFQDEPRTKKPIGIYWLQAVAVKAFSAGELTRTWPYRLPSVLGAWIAVLATCRFGRRAFDPLTGMIAGGMLATTIVVIAEAHLAKTDAALLAATTLAMTALGEIYLDDKPRWRAVVQFWLALAAGILLKGPVAPMIAGTAIVGLSAADHKLAILRRTRPVAGILLTALIVVPWLLTQRDTGFATQAFREDILPKLLGGQEGHGAPPGTHLLMTLVTAWPWSLFLPFALILAWWERARPAVRFCLAWVIPAWVVFELAPTKLPHYTLPLMPALMLLTAHWIRSPSPTMSHGWALAFRVLWGWIGIALAVAILVATRRYDGNIIAGTLAATLVLAVAGLALARALQPKFVIAAGTLAGVFAMLTIADVLPQLNHLFVSRRLADAVAARETRPSVPIALAEFHEPSAVFLLGTKTVLADLDQIPAYLRTPGALSVVPVSRLEDVRAGLASAGKQLEELDEIDGFNYSRGRWVRLALVTAH